MSEKSATRTCDPGLAEPAKRTRWALYVKLDYFWFARDLGPIADDLKEFVNTILRKLRVQSAFPARQLLRISEMSDWVYVKDL
jgi:hypothetical protein